MKVFGPRRLADEHRQAEVAAGLVQESIDETRLLLRSELALPELVEVALLEDAARGERAARERVTDAEAEEVVLKAGRLADEARAVRGRLPLQVEVHVRVAGARVRRYVEMMQSLRGRERVIEVRIDLLEIRDDRAAERGDAVEDEEVRVAARRELVVEVDVDELGVLGSESVGATLRLRSSLTGIRPPLRSHVISFASPSGEAGPVATMSAWSGDRRLLKMTFAPARCACARRPRSSVPSSAPRWMNQPYGSLLRITRADVAVVVERGPVCGAEVEVALDAEAVEKVGDRLGFRRAFDDLQVADEARADIALCLVNLDRASGARERDGGGEAGWSRARDPDQTITLHNSPVWYRAVQARIPQYASHVIDDSRRSVP